jgi:curved DNA-binding protein CbpA
MPLVRQGDGGGLYRRLDVAPGASSAEIGRAYRRLAHGAHPDAHPDDPDASGRFQQITEAYQVLSDPGRRARYDRAHRPPDATLTTSAPTGGPGREAPPSAWGFVSRPLQAPPVVIGTAPIFTGSADLIAGPVRLEPTPGARSGFSPSEEEAAAAFAGAHMARLLSIVLGPRW